MPASIRRDLSGHPLLRALAERELPVRRGSLATIVFLRDRNAKGQVNVCCLQPDGWCCSRNCSSQAACRHQKVAQLYMLQEVSGYIDLGQRLAAPSHSGDSAPQMQEVSGYIDLGQRLAADEAGMAAVFALQVGPELRG